MQLRNGKVNTEWPVLIRYENDEAISKAMDVLLITWKTKQSLKQYEVVHERRYIGCGSASQVYRYQDVVAKIFYQEDDLMHVQMDDIYILPSIDHIPIYPKCYGFVPKTMIFKEYIEGPLLESFEGKISTSIWNRFFNGLIDTVLCGFMPTDLYSFNIIVSKRGLVVVDVGAFKCQPKNNKIVYPSFLEEDIPFVKPAKRIFENVVQSRGFQVIH